MKYGSLTIRLALLGAFALGVGATAVQAEESAESATRTHAAAANEAGAVAEVAAADEVAVEDLAAVDDAPLLDRGRGILTNAVIGYLAVPDTATFVFDDGARLGQPVPLPLTDAETAAVTSAVAALDYGATVVFMANPVRALVTLPGVDLAARVTPLRDAVGGAVPRLQLELANLAIADCGGTRAEAEGRAADAAATHAVALAAAVGSRAEELVSVDMSVTQPFGADCVVARRASPASLASAAIEFVGSASAVHELVGGEAPRLRTFATGSAAAPIGWVRLELVDSDNDAGSALRARLLAAGMPASAFQAGGPNVYLRVPTTMLDSILSAIEPALAGATINSLFWEAADCDTAVVSAEAAAVRAGRDRISRFAQRQKLVLGALSYLSASSLPYDDLRGSGNCTGQGSSLASRPRYLPVMASVTVGYAAE